MIQLYQSMQSVCSGRAAWHNGKAAWPNVAAAQAGEKT
jgi:hypothetical protein